ncbi:hypothetical protein PIB30_073171 [Stylosanthes scabra]|uniref:Uncharacterized protein n=1 Tax=Stylosanthes scabra TaxID=79078 RepID=A0ABU6ZN40_9FABA|nr:hypothetical protein [Stylosanthes scabra]
MDSSPNHVAANKILPKESLGGSKIEGCKEPEAPRELTLFEKGELKSLPSSNKRGITMCNSPFFFAD